MEAGRLYVAENRGYPTGPGKGKAPAGIIALLEDTDWTDVSINELSLQTA